jgi:hypothetical protein
MMYTANEQLKALKAQALQHLQSVDLITPMKQLDAVLEALIEVPTKERRSDTDFARQAAVALDMLVRHTHRLLVCVDTLTEHVRCAPVPVIK